MRIAVQRASHRRSNKELLIDLQKSLCAGYFMNSARRCQGLQTFMTLGEPVQMVHLPHDSPAEVATANAVIFHELLWTGMTHMRHVTPVDMEQLQRYFPRLESVDVGRLCGRPPQDRSKLTKKVKSQGSTNQEQDAEDKLAAAKVRFLARKKQKT